MEVNTLHPGVKFQLRISSCQGLSSCGRFPGWGYCSPGSALAVEGFSGVGEPTDKFANAAWNVVGHESSHSWGLSGREREREREREK